MTTHHTIAASARDILSLPELNTAWQSFSNSVHATVQTIMSHPAFGPAVHSSPQQIADSGLLEPFIHTAILEPMRWLLPSIYAVLAQALPAHAERSSIANNLGTGFANSMVPLLLNPLLPHFDRVAAPFAAMLNLCGIEKASDDLHILNFEVCADGQRIHSPYRPVLERFVTTVLGIIDSAGGDLHAVSQEVRSWDIPVIASPISSTLQSLFARLPREGLQPFEYWWVDHPLHTILMLNLIAVALVVESSAAFPARVQDLVLETLRQRYSGVQAQLAHPTMPLHQALHVGTDTILVKHVFAVLLGCVLLARPQQYPAIERHWETLLRAIHGGAGIIRLANDLGPLTNANLDAQHTLRSLQPDYSALFPYALFAELRQRLRQDADSASELVFDRLLRDAEGREYNIVLCASSGEWAAAPTWPAFWRNLEHAQRIQQGWTQDFDAALQSFAADCPEMAYLMRSFVAYNDQLYQRGGDYDDVRHTSHGALSAMQQSFTGVLDHV